MIWLAAAIVVHGILVFFAISRVRITVASSMHPISTVDSTPSINRTEKREWASAKASNMVIVPDKVDCNLSAEVDEVNDVSDAADKLRRLGK